MSSPSDFRESRIPVTIVTGFLGAGKTTLLQRIVRECQWMRIAIIQNEVSEEMGIESAVLTDSNGNIIPDFFELPNGCICCTSKDDMVTTLENIVNLGRERIDAVVVETTGIADPCSVAEIFWVDSELCSSIYLDGIVSVVDCKNFISVIQSDHFLEHSDIGRKQVAIADRILINKSDLVSSSDIDQTSDLLKSLNPEADIIVTSNSVVDPEWVLNIGSFDPSKLSLSSHHHHAVSTIDHVFLTIPNSKFLKHEIELFLGDILWEEKYGKVYRAKGLFRDECGGWKGLQAVGALFEIVDQDYAKKLEKNENGVAKFLFIGHNIDRKMLQTKLGELAI